MQTAATVPEERLRVVFQPPAVKLPLRVMLEEPLDDDEFYAFCRANSELIIERSAEGELLIMAPTGSETGRRSFSFTGLLFEWARRDGTGVGFDSSAGFKLPNGATRAPDAAWVKKDRWNALTQDQREKFAPLAPDFVAELRSRTDDLEELKEKLAEYVAQGVRLGWLIDPQSKSVWVYRPGVAPVELKTPTVDGGEVLPGFVLTLSDIW